MMISTKTTMSEAPPMAVAGIPLPGMGFGLGFSVRLTKGPEQGEYGWSGYASTHFWVSPKQELAVVALQQFTPFTMRLETAVKPLVYAAVEK